jgi:hypothetical protein
MAGKLLTNPKWEKEKKRHQAWDSVTSLPLYSPPINSKSRTRIQDEAYRRGSRLPPPSHCRRHGERRHVRRGEQRVGERFDREYGLDYAGHFLSEAAAFTWAVFNQTSLAERRPVDRVGLLVNDTDDSTIVLNAGYVNNYTAGDRHTVPRVGARVAVGPAGLRRALVGVRGDRRLRAPQRRLRASALGEAGAGEQLGQGVRRDSEVPGLLRWAVPRVRRDAQRQAQGRVQ